MTQHLSDELPRLLTGDATRDVVLAAAEHLRTCPDCQQELISAVVAHASLTSAHRFAPDVVAPELPTEHEIVTTPDVGPLPDMSGMFAQIRDEADAHATTVARRSARRKMLSVAAAVVVLLGGGAAAIALEENGGSGPAAQQVALSAYDVGDHSASATIQGSSVHIDAKSLPPLGTKRRYEVWLTDTARHRMQSVGFMTNGRTMSTSVPSDVLSQYNDIEVSVQRLGESRYSGISVLRGQYG